MQIRESLHYQIDALGIEQLLIAQEFLAVLGAEKIKVVPVASPHPYLEVKAALSALRGSLAEEIINA